MNKPCDFQQRQEALNIGESFLVQAPAGSGKTELLIQRYLKLLSLCVTNPEEIIAITFTRKAAGEMRQRIIRALEEALQDSVPEGEHHQQTRNLATQAVQKDRELAWKLVENPNRLKIMTIDALCARITKQLPLLSQFGAQPDVEENMEHLFIKASELVLGSLEEDLPWNNALVTLLNYIDNDANRVQRLFVSMLYNREQWLPWVLENNPRHHLQQTLVDIIEDQLQKTRNLLTFAEADISCLLDYAAGNLKESDPDHPLCCHENQKGLLPGSYEYLQAWQTLADFFVTDSGKWRSRFTKNEGIPPSGKKQKTIEDPRKILSALMPKLHENPDLLSALIAVKKLPAPGYTQEQWDVLNALITLLPVLVAQLHLLFQQSDTVDYTEISLRALQSLGSPENPTELALVLDYKIRHILVDEFQDTSVSQFRLLEMLTSGWEPHDGRTMFLVGDPMQSIYRFRKAEVGLFIKARDYGINDIMLKFLRLEVNFRSTRQIVEWNNRVYQKIFPDRDDLALSAVKFSSSSAQAPVTDQSHIQLHPCIMQGSMEFSESENMVNTIRSIQNQHPEKKIAVLVLARSHLIDILKKFKRNSMAFRAIELESLASNPVIQDLLALMKALIDLSDSIAWYSLLRSPCIGLTLADLLVISTNIKNDSVYSTLEVFEDLPFSEDGKARLYRTFPIIKHAWLSLRDFDPGYLIESTWLALGGADCIDEADLLNVRRFFSALEKFEIRHDINEIPIFESALQKLTAESPTPAGNYIEVMTIHKSKGLEFDVVCIPGLDRATRGDDHQLLAWQEITTGRHKNKLLLAPIKTGKSEPIYDYLRALEGEKLKNELNRLLYVATTRAKSHLYLFFSLNVDENDPAVIKQPRAGSLLAQLWPAIQNTVMNGYKPQPNTTAYEKDVKATQLKRLVSGWHNPLTDTGFFNVFKNQNSLVTNRHLANWNFEFQKVQGVVIHALLEYMGRSGPGFWKQPDQQEISMMVEKIMSRFPLTTESQDSIRKNCHESLKKIINDPKGQWIFGTRGFSEYAVHYVDEHNQIQKSVMDRVIFDNKTVWVVDFKTSEPDGESTEIFLEKQKSIHHSQLSHYQNLLERLFENPVRSGLYFPLIPAWIDVD